MPQSVTVEIGGRSFYAGRGEFIIEENDPLGFGFPLAEHFADIAQSR
jgi:trans-L-3-hydroxyproline dehydratase